MLQQTTIPYSDASFEEENCNHLSCLCQTQSFCRYRRVWRVSTSWHAAVSIAVTVRFLFVNTKACSCLGQMSLLHASKSLEYNYPSFDSLKMWAYVYMNQGPGLGLTAAPGPFAAEQAAPTAGMRGCAWCWRQLVAKDEVGRDKKRWSYIIISRHDSQTYINFADFSLKCR